MANFCFTDNDQSFIKHFKNVYVEKSTKWIKRKLHAFQSITILTNSLSFIPIDLPLQFPPLLPFIMQLAV